ncbi:MAG: hypothetical protein J6Y94_02745, partial [Bacteriovoracaceae bacterium]|nr:hypothetical protein [Bacteriovoracaceae bacterium]
MISEILTTLSVLPLGPILASLGLAVLSIFITVKFYQGLTRIPPNLVKVLTPIFKSKKYLPLLLLALGIAALTKSFFILASVIVGCILVSTSVKTHAENSPTLLQIAFQSPASIYLSYPVFCIINFQIIFDPDADFAIADLIRNGGISLCMDMILWPAFIVLVQGLWIFLKQHTLHSSLVLFNVVFNLYYLPVHKTLYKNYPLFDTELAIIQFGLLLALMVTMIKTCSQLTLPQNRTTNLKIIQWST